MKLRLIPAALLLASPAPCAWAAEKIPSPNIIKDQLQLEYMVLGEDMPRGQRDRLRQRAQVSYGFTDELNLAISGIVENRANESTQLAGPSLRTRYQTTAQEDGWWLNTALQARYNHQTDGRPRNFSAGFLLQRAGEDFTTTIAVNAARELGEGRAHGAGATFAAQSFYRYHPMFMPGVEIYSNAGRLNAIEFDDTQSQEIGPMVTGVLPLDDTRGLGYTAGYYWGMNDRSPDQSFKFHLNYIEQF